VATRLVYSSDRGRLCPTCGWPVGDCRCSAQAVEEVPARVVAKIRLESKGRGGKQVTVVDGLPHNPPFLDELVTALKKACATGGTIRPGAIELAGDVRDRVRPLLQSRGFVVKG
jgi:translation initiation factor 1